jgi:hypothetical protein
MTARRALRGVALVAVVVAGAVIIGMVVTPRGYRASVGSQPLRVAGDQRTLVDAQGRPFLPIVDTAWTWLSDLSDRAEADAYLDVRKRQGFNTVMSFMTSFRPRYLRKAGVPAFIDGDIGRPDDAYFEGVDALVRDAAARGMTVMMGPLNLSDNLPSTPDGLPTIDRWAAYGRYVGRRYEHFDNIIWFMGGDHDVHQIWDDTGDYTAYIDAMADAVKSVDRRHLMTYHPALDTYVLGDKDWLDFYAFQENRADSSPFSYERVKSYYEHPPIKPVIDLEPGYETGDALTDVVTTPFMVRRNAWWALLQGALGVVYGGNRATFAIGHHPADDWRAYVELDGARQTGLMGGMLAGLRWQDLVPDSAHRLVTEGFGTFGDKDYTTAGQTPDGRLALVYVPTGTAPTLDLSRLAGPVRATWADPSTGRSIRVPGGPLTAEGSHTFDVPGPNAAGDRDWLLVLTGPVVASPKP